jgi:membrane fusion protein, multidrug efflux system
MIRISAFSVLALSLLAACGKAPPRPSPAVPVTTAAAARRDVPVVLEATGTVEPIRTVQVRAQVDGVITRVAFREGDEVAAGQVLFQIDPRPYQAGRDKAVATLARDRALARQAQSDLSRLSELAAKEYLTAQQLDQAKAQAEQTQATLRADSAAVEQASLDLGYATVRAAISGRTGSVLLKEGNLVRASSTGPLVVINQLAPIRVRFSLPARDLAEIRKRAGHDLPVTATPVGTDDAVVSGVLSFVDNAVDTLTGTIALKAAFENKSRTLWPGELVRVRMELDVEKGVLVVPQSAVVTGQEGASLFVVMPDGTVQFRKVQVLRTSDSIAVLAGGVEPGEKVVTDGQLRLTDGAKVQPRESEPQP